MNCYNSDRFLYEAIDSIYNQTYNNWEIIFWDNRSTDRSPIIAKSYDDRLKYYLSENMTNLGEARNLAMNKAKGKYIAFLDCDDLFLIDKLKTQVEFMEKNDLVFSYGSSIIINETGTEIKRIMVKNYSGYIFNSLLKHYEIAMQSVMIKRDIIDNENFRFNKNLIYSPDYNLFMNIAAKYEIGVIKTPIIKYRLVSGSLSDQTTSIASSEMKHTLNQLSEKFPELKKIYKKEFKSAFNKSQYYSAVSDIYQMDRKLARDKLIPIIFSHYAYFILYLLLFFPIPEKYILKILGR